MLLGFRSNAAKTDFSKILEEEMEQAVKDAAEISMGTEISAEDLLIVNYLSEQVEASVTHAHIYGDSADATYGSSVSIRSVRNWYVCRPQSP